MDDLKKSHTVVKEDTTRVLLLAELSLWSIFSNPDTSIQLAQEGIRLAQQINDRKGEAYCKRSSGFYFWSIGDYTTAIKLAYSGMPYAEAVRDSVLQGWLNDLLLNAYRDNGDYSEALKIDFNERKRAEELHFIMDANRNAITASIYYGMNKLDSALYYMHLSNQLDSSTGWTCMIMGRIQAKLHHTDSAFYFYKLSIQKLLEESNFKDLASAYQSTAALYHAIGNIDSAIYYAREGLSISQKKAFAKEQLELYSILADVYEKRNTDSALHYYKMAVVAKDNLFNREKAKQVVSFQFNEELRQWEIRNAKMQYKNRLRTYGFVGGIAVFVVIAFLQWRNYRHQQRAYALLQKQKLKTDDALLELKETQAQLIQREKMASLGELTAGIAHEIQNPLNFVNNFSELNKELIADMKQELAAGDVEDATTLARDIEENEEKIHFHGKRADAIVKSMLLHSRSTSGDKQPTDLNALADEYLRLSYHGQRALDKTFTATLETSFDDSIGKVYVVPQDLSRVLLNLFNNAFYSVAEKMKQPPTGYEPLIKVSTHKQDDKIEIAVYDNGLGISGKIVEKVFQPFFTTKPTGQGTGLGLSLSYDIITKEHGGTLRVDTKEGEYARFVIQLPAIDSSNSGAH